MAAPMATWLSSSAFLNSGCVQVVYTKETKETKNSVVRPNKCVSQQMCRHFGVPGVGSRLKSLNFEPCGYQAQYALAAY